ncbi:DUF364 domain-containing protein [Desulfonema magnum]|uniref:Heavy-metal chelation domain-containing protein, DUF4213 domain-containing n=1 Tax=Desulfonema magnum TaxID=45655 RepID=A0A975BTA3_9BACT|nr:DUF364 domain-containing protein [Desulfonema magnum]QTA91223.1 Putative heavy-metal chelation domain-containing protein, DUF4213 domain-containing [Desulfonema magnum]
MKLNDRLYDLFADKAKSVTIEVLSLGLGYTAVTTSDGGMGISYTYFESKKSCALNKDYDDYEGKSASGLLEKIRSTDTVQRSMALALINALNYESALSLPEDRKNTIMFEKFNIGQGTKVAMVGFFGPMMRLFKERKAELEVMDSFRGLGGKENFYEKLENWADVLFLTSTSILNNTTEEILERTGETVKTVMIGPSTPMVREAFENLPVQMLAGTVPVEKEKVLKAVRHGTGTPVIQRFSKKSFLDLF